MPSFPNSIFSPASKNTGDTIQAAHVTDLDSEVVALEQGLRNGTAPLNSSNSTFTALSVSGGSTLATLQVTGNSTLAGSVVLSSLVTAPAQPRCHVYSTAAQALAANVFTAIAFESEEHDVGGLHSTASSPERLTVPAGSSGLYLCGAVIRLSTGGAGSAAVARIVKNSTTEVTVGNNFAISSFAAVSAHLTGPIVLDGGDFVTAEVFPIGSTASTPAASVRRTASELWAIRIW